MTPSPRSVLPKAVFFDAAGTLFKLSRPVGEQYREVALRHGLDLPAEALESAFRAAWKGMPARPSTGGPRPDDDRGWWRGLVTEVFKRLETPLREPVFADLYGHFREPSAWAVYPEVPAVLETLSGQCRLAVVSNFDGRLRNVLKGHGLLSYFTEIVLSSEVGADKPDPAIFRAALRRLGVAPAEAVHAGDDPDLDWEGARAAGIRPFKLDRPRNSLRDLLEWDFA